MSTATPRSRAWQVTLSWAWGLSLTAGIVWLVLVWAPLPMLNAMTPGGTARVERDVAYVSAEDLAPEERRSLDIYHPRGRAPQAGWPVVVFFFGGTWRTGDRADYAFVGEALAARGMLTLIANYRLYPEVRYPDFLRDSAAALAWGLRESVRLGGDPQRVFVMGHSAGAYNAAMLALDPRWLQEVGAQPAALAGWIGVAGPYDFLPIQNPDAKPVFFHPDYPAGSQPIDHVATATLPAFLAAGLTDTLVNPERNSRHMAELLQQRGLAVTLRQYPGVGHGALIAAFGGPLRWLAPVLDDVDDFVQTPRGGG